MTRINILSILVVLLLGLNIMFVTKSILSNKKDEQKRLLPAEMDKRKVENVKRLLSWNDEQLSLFEESKTKHLAEIEMLKSELYSLSNQFYQSTQGQSKLRDSLLYNIDSINTQVYMVNIEHFDDLRSISTAEQKKKIEEFIKHLLGNQRKKPHNQMFRHK